MPNASPTKRSLIAALLLSASACGGQPRPDPPVPVEVKVLVPIPCDVTEPQPPAWAYDNAVQGMPLDDKVRFMRAELAQRAAFEAEQRAALQACKGKGTGGG